MNSIRVAIYGVCCASLLAQLPARAEDFFGSFTGSYFSGWTSFINDNPVVTDQSSFDLKSYALTLSGSASPSLTEVSPASVIDFTHAVVGTGPTTISFKSLFYAENTAHELDTAAFLVNGSVMQDLTFPGEDRTYTFVLNPGDIFGFRLTSDNDNTKDVLQITQVPEPGIVALGALAGLVWLGSRARRD